MSGLVGGCGHLRPRDTQDFCPASSSLSKVNAILSSPKFSLGTSAFLFKQLCPTSKIRLISHAPSQYSREEQISVSLSVTDANPINKYNAPVLYILFSFFLFLPPTASQSSRLSYTPIEKLVFRLRSTLARSTLKKALRLRYL